jgi:tetratricopeptide (TPR) repeat protein
MKNLLRILLIVATGAWIYSPVLHGRWLWDDDRYITDNPLLREPGGLAKIWLWPTTVNYFPVTSTVQWLQWRAWGADPFGYHVTNVALHLVSGLLLWRLLVRLRGGPSTSLRAFDSGAVPGGRARTPTAEVEWLGGWLWVAHPIAVESVAWISELKNTLALVFLLLAMLAYIEFDDAASAETASAPVERVDPNALGVRPRSRTKRIGVNALHRLSVLFFILAMLSKSLVAMFPVTILLYAWWRRGRLTAGDARSSAPFFAVSLVLGVVTVVFEHRAIGVSGAAIGGPLSRLACAGLALAFYLAKCALPFALLPIYPRWNVDPPSPLQFLPWLALAGLLWLLWTRRSGWGRHALFGLGFFLLLLVPVIGFAPMAYQRISWVADHFAYLALPGLVGVATAGLGALPSRMAPGKSWLVLAATALLCVGLAADSRQYARRFTDGKTLWTYALERNPDSWMVHSNLGVERMKDGDASAAMAQFETALRLDPAAPEAHANLGVALANLGRWPEAIAQGEAAVRLAPDYGPGREKLAEIRTRANSVADTWFNQGNSLAQSGRWEEAAADFEQALRLAPGFPEAHTNLGNVLFSLHRLPEAVDQYRAALRLKPDYADAHYNLGLALRALGRAQEGSAEIETARRLGAGR